MLPLSEAMARNGGPTVISSRDIKAGRWMPRVPSLVNRMVRYVEALEEGGRQLTIWNDHCLNRIVYFSNTSGFTAHLSLGSD